jgi:CheY-like chemotaxis protein
MLAHDFLLWPFPTPMGLIRPVIVDTIRTLVGRLNSEIDRIGCVRNVNVPLRPPSKQRTLHFGAPCVRLADQLGKVRILLADDHRPFLNIVEGLLLSVCEIVGRVPDGQSLIEAAVRLNPDVILTDISMPILNGIDASQQLSDSGCTAKIIFLTAHSDTDFVDACLATGALGFVTKSRMIIDLLPAVEDALAGRVFVSPVS